MRLSLAVAAFAALSIGASSGAHAQQDPPVERVGRSEQVVPTPIRAFSDAAGQWHGWVDLDTRVTMFVTSDGMVRFRGPRNVTQQAIIVSDRLVVQSRSTDLDCSITNGFLTCNARFGTWYASLNLSKQ